MSKYKAFNKKNNRFPKVIICVILIVACGVAVALGIIYASKQFELNNHPLEYTDYVEKYAKQYQLDKYLVYAVIKTESGFNPDSESNVGARGLMQIMTDTFDWIKFRLGETDNEELTFNSMYQVETNIRYGCYLLWYLKGLFGGVEEMAAAYHAGSGKVSEWLANAEYSADGKTLDAIPISDTEHYVNKIVKAYETYKKLYSGGN